LVNTGDPQLEVVGFVHGGHARKEICIEHSFNAKAQEFAHSAVRIWPLHLAGDAVARSVCSPLGFIDDVFEERHELLFELKGGGAKSKDDNMVDISKIRDE
jgi:hypothetical protein